MIPEAESGAAGHAGAGAAGSGVTAGTATGRRRGVSRGGPDPLECRGHDIDIPSATLAGALSINGVPATADPNTRLLLRNGVTDLVEIPFAGASYSVRLAPGTYDVFFSATGPTAIAPANRFARLHGGIVITANETTTLDVDVRETIVSGVITINGAALAVDDTVDLSLRNAAGDTVPLAAASNGSFTARVVPGTFDLYYASNVVAAGSATPTNQLARIANGITIGATPTATLDVDVPSVTVSGTIAIGGVAAGPTNRGWVYLRNAAGDIVRIAVANAASYTARVVPGNYDLYFTGTEDVYSVTNQNTLLRTGVVVGAAGTTVLDVQVPAATVEGITAHRRRATPGDRLRAPGAAQRGRRLRPDPVEHGRPICRARRARHLRPFYAKDNTVQSSTPANQLAKLRAGVVVAPTGTTALDIDITSTW